MFYIKNGDMFVTKNKKESCNIDHAAMFPTTEDLESFLLRFKEKEREKFVLCSQNNEVSFILATEKREIADKEIEEMVLQAQSTSRLVSKRLLDLRTSLADTDKAVVDMYHYIEFSKLNAREGYKAYKMLHDTLNKRREIKNKIQAFNAIGKVFNESSVSKALDGVLSSCGEKTYAPRVMPELF